MAPSSAYGLKRTCGGGLRNLTTGRAHTRIFGFSARARSSAGVLVDDADLRIRAGSFDLGRIRCRRDLARDHCSR